MMDRESSDEEEDRKNLIHENVTPNDAVKSPNQHHRSAFSIDDNLRSRFTGAARMFNKRCVFRRLRRKGVIILLLIEYVNLNCGLCICLSGRNLSFSIYGIIPQCSGNNFLASPMSEDLKSRVFGQISLNKQIQGILLSAHENRGSLDLTENYTDAVFSSWNRCGKVDQRLSERKTIEWKPKSNKYLFAICVSGQMSNHLICLEKHMFFAALLNRILVIPSAKVDYAFHRVLDIDHINKCLGRKVVVTFEEFAESKKHHFRVDRFMCYFSSPQPCFIDDEHVKKLKGLGLSLSKIEAVWKEDVKKPNKRTVEDVIAKYSSDDDVIAIGDVFFADVESEWVMQPGGPIASKCQTLIEPSRLILLTAQRFIQTFLGNDFTALHFRRHGFLKFCNAKHPSCFYPVPQAAECINRVVEMANTPVIYLSTDAAGSETGLLQSLIVLNRKTVPLVQRPARNAAEKWNALLYRHGLEGDLQVEAMLDKTICALSSVFIGSSGSTFTEDILRLRKDWGSASLCDSYLCQGELPNFIAEDE
ncbi:hypothetical protein OROHE_004029 [Orobanche hederae]